jgi:molybdopterin-containing oxidoreductase family iron-sulfur binding subunit
MDPVIKTHRKNKGKGLAFLSEYITSPSLAAVKSHVLEAFPEARWHTYEPVSRDRVSRGYFMATGQHVEPHYNFQAADTVLSLDCDFLGKEINSLPNSRVFADKRDPDKGRANRLYTIESDSWQT